MTNEAVIALQEGVASAADIDLAMMAGIGYPKEKRVRCISRMSWALIKFCTSLRILPGRWGPAFGLHRCCGGWWMPVSRAAWRDGGFSRTEDLTPRAQGDMS